MAEEAEPSTSADEDESTDEETPASKGEVPRDSSAEGANPDERLAKVQAAFERGDYAQVRALATPLIAEGGPLAESASDLVQRTRVDPAQVGVLVGCLLFFCFILWKYVL